MAFKTRVRRPGAKPRSKGTQRDLAQKWRPHSPDQELRKLNIQSQDELADSDVGGGQEPWEEPPQSTVLFCLDGKLEVKK